MAIQLIPYIVIFNCKRLVWKFENDPPLLHCFFHIIKFKILNKWLHYSTYGTGNFNVRGL